MHRSIVIALVIACGLAFALAAQAQQAPREHSMTGCLKKGTEANSYIVTDVEGAGPKSIGIVSSTANLAPHVGHKIEVTGTAVPVKDAEEMKPAPPKAPHYMKLTAIKMVSATCRFSVSTIRTPSGPKSAMALPPDASGCAGSRPCEPCSTKRFGDIFDVTMI